jgi:hypothetical protein
MCVHIEDGGWSVTSTVPFVQWPTCGSFLIEITTPGGRKMTVLVKQALAPPATNYGSDLGASVHILGEIVGTGRPVEADIADGWSVPASGPRERVSKLDIRFPQGFKRVRGLPRVSLSRRGTGRGQAA